MKLISCSLIILLLSVNHGYSAATIGGAAKTSGVINGKTIKHRVRK